MTDRKHWSLQEIVDLHRQATEKKKVHWYPGVRDLALAALFAGSLAILRFFLEKWLR